MNVAHNSDDFVESELVNGMKIIWKMDEGLYKFVKIEKGGEES